MPAQHAPERHGRGPIEGRGPPRCRSPPARGRVGGLPLIAPRVKCKQSPPTVAGHNNPQQPSPPCCWERGLQKRSPSASSRGGLWPCYAKVSAHRYYWRASFTRVMQSRRSADRWQRRASLRHRQVPATWGRPAGPCCHQMAPAGRRWPPPGGRHGSRRGRRRRLRDGATPKPPASTGTGTAPCGVAKSVPGAPRGARAAGRPQAASPRRSHPSQSSWNGSSGSRSAASGSGSAGGGGQPAGPAGSCDAAGSQSRAAEGVGGRGMTRAAQWSLTRPRPLVSAWAAGGQGSAGSGRAPSQPCQQEISSSHAAIDESAGPVRRSPPPPAAHGLEAVGPRGLRGGGDPLNPLCTGRTARGAPLRCAFKFGAA